MAGKPLWEHAREDHEGEMRREWFKMTMVKKHQTALQRQIREALAIEGSGADVILNKKCEWNGSRIPRLRVEVGVKLDEEDRDEKGAKRPKKIVSSIPEKRRLGDDLVEVRNHKKFRHDEENESEKHQEVRRQLNTSLVSIDNEKVLVVDLDKETGDRQEEEEKKVQVDKEGSKRQNNDIVREVTPDCVNCFFVKCLDSPGQVDAARDDIWPEEELLEAAALSEDMRQREEEVAQSKRPFCAGEILLEKVSDRIDLRKEVKKWTKTIWLKTLERVVTEVTVRKITEHFEHFIDDKDDSDETLGGKTPNIKKKEDDQKHEKEVLEKKRADLRLEWKKVWERGPTPTIIEERKKSTAKKRKESRMKKKEGKEKDEKKNGVFLQRWIHGSNPEETSKSTQPDQPGIIGEIKKKLGMTDNSEKKGKEDDTENKKRKFTAIRSKFEKEDTPRKIRK